MCGRIGALPLGQRLRPIIGDDFQEIQREPPPVGKVAIDQTGKARPVGARRLHLVDQAGEVARQPERIGRRGRNDDLLLEERRHMRRQPAFPFLHQRGERQHAVEIGDRRGDVERGRAGRIDQRELLVELAERADRRQDGRTAGRLLHEDRAQRAGGAAGRQIDGDGGKRERIAVGAKAGHQFAGGQRVGQRRQEGRAGRDGKNARRSFPRHDTLAAAIAASASVMASGVPTVIQRPRMRQPKRRPSAAVLSK